jgi:hypothetical protein
LLLLVAVAVAQQQLAQVSQAVLVVAQAAIVHLMQAKIRAVALVRNLQYLPHPETLPLQ